MIEYTIKELGGTKYVRQFESETMMREWVEVQLLSAHPHWYVDWVTRDTSGPVHVSTARVKNESWVPIPGLGVTVVWHDDNKASFEDTERLWELDQHGNYL